MNGLLTRLWGRLPIPSRARSALIWWLSAKFNVGVAGLVRDDEGRVLLLRHTYRPARPWGLPGGGLRSGETLEDCLRREMREETGLRIEVLGLLSAAAHLDRKLVDMIFVCRLAAGETLDNFKSSAEVVEARFFSLGELPEEMSRGQRRLIFIANGQAGRDKSFGYQPSLGDWF
jgi:8-oxo-dGTP diphosphatase